MRTAYFPGLGGLAPGDWNALVSPDDPFTDYRFLHALETSGAVGPGTGWAPAHVCVFDGETLVGASPFYEKTDSYGEFIFDFSWANAAMRAGLRYYPKFVAAVPFTPATGSRFLVRPGAGEAAVRRLLAQGMLEAAARAGASSAHVLFLRDDEAAALEGGPWLRRLTYQFHWENAGYRAFDDYLASLRAPSRKQVRRERREAAAQGLRLATVAGPDMTADEWRALYRFYRTTAERKGGYAYLPPAFYERIRETYADHVLATFAYDPAGRPVAGAIAFAKGKRLYGRYWGTLVDAPMLHFELCYYRFIEWSIEHGMERFEAGAQGEHKLKRGFLPSPTHSLHHLAHPDLRSAVAHFLEREREGVRGEMDELAESTPFKRGEP